MFFFSSLLPPLTYTINQRLTVKYKDLLYQLLCPIIIGHNNLATQDLGVSDFFNFKLVHFCCYSFETPSV